MSNFHDTMPFCSLYIIRINLLMDSTFPYTLLIYHVHLYMYYAFLCLMYYTHPSKDLLHISLYFTHVLCLSFLYIFHVSVYWLTGNLLTMPFPPFYSILLHVLIYFTFSYTLLYSCTMPFFSLNIVLIHLLITLHLLVLYSWTMSTFICTHRFIGSSVFLLYYLCCCCFIYMYIYIHICIYMYICICIYIYTYTYTYICVYIYIYTYTYIYIYM